MIRSRDSHIRSLGIGWGEPDAMGHREIAGISDGLVRLVPKAREAIEIELEHREATGLAVSAKVANWIAHKVRQAKHHEPSAGSRPCPAPCDLPFA